MPVHLEEEMLLNPALVSVLRHRRRLRRALLAFLARLERVDHVVVQREETQGIPPGVGAEQRQTEGVVGLVQPQSFGGFFSEGLSDAVSPSPVDVCERTEELDGADSGLLEKLGRQEGATRPAWMYHSTTHEDLRRHCQHWLPMSRSGSSNVSETFALLGPANGLDGHTQGRRGKSKWAEEEEEEEGEEEKGRKGSGLRLALRLFGADLLPDRREQVCSFSSWSHQHHRLQAY